MNATILYRTAAVLFVLFALAHTVGFLQFRPETAEGVAVYDTMNAVRFQFGNATASYGGFHVGFGLMITVYLVFSAVVAWHLGTLARTMPSAIGPIGWAFAVSQLASLALSWIYFALPPALFSAVIAACLAAAAWTTTSTPIRGS